MKSIEVKNNKELNTIKKTYSFVFVPSGPGGKVNFPVTVTVKK